MRTPLRIHGLDTAMRDAIKRAAEWGMSEGFRMGWKVYEVTEGGAR